MTVVSVSNPDRRQFLLWSIPLTAATIYWPPLRAADVHFEQIRNYAISTMRLAELTPPWFVSGNWDNRRYGPWTDYLTGKLSEADFLKVCANPSDYCLRDLWDLTKPEATPIDWRRAPPLNWAGIHALALRYFRTGEPIYLKKWFAVVQDFSVNRPRQLGAQIDALISNGNPAALLDSAMVWCGIFTALTILAKGATGLSGALDRGKASPFAAYPDRAESSELNQFPPEQLLSIVRRFATNDAVHLGRFYAPPTRVPNQRLFGLEALAYLLAFFPMLPESKSLVASTHAGLLDVFTRYTHRDGGQLEQSFGYAEGMALAAERLAKLRFVSPTPWNEEAQVTVEGWRRMASSLATPQGGLPQVGNTVWSRHGKIADPPHFGVTSIAFPYSGYYVQRSSWNADAGYLFFFFRREARGHTMAGCNSIQLGAYGRQLLVAGGSANYRGKSTNYPESPAYLAEACSYKTNTVLVDGQFQNGGSLQGLHRDSTGNPDILSVPALPVLSRWHTSAHFDFVEGLFDRGYRGSLDGNVTTPVEDVHHWRQVVFVRSLMVWIVIDVMLTTTRHRYTQVWKFAAPRNGLAIPGFNKEQVRFDQSEKTIRTQDSGPNAANISLLHFGVKDLTYRSYFGEGPFGYVSPGPLSEAVPAVDVHANWSGEGNQILITVIHPYLGIGSPVRNTTDFSSKALSNFKLEMGDSSRLSCLASSLPQTLAMGRISAPASTLIITLERPEHVERGIVLAPRNSYEFVGTTSSAISIPEGFRWITNSKGLLEPAYTVNG